MLKIIGSIVVDRMRKSGLMTSSQDLKFHLTLMNTRYRKDKSGTTELDEVLPGRNERRRETFDARGILDRFKEYRLGSAPLTCIQIFQLYTGTNRPSDAEYLSIGRILFY